MDSFNKNQSIELFQWGIKMPVHLKIQWMFSNCLESMHTD